MHGMLTDHVSIGGNILLISFFKLIYFISVLAFSPNNNEIHIYETKNWTLVNLLSEVIVYLFYVLIS